MRQSSPRGKGERKMDKVICLGMTGHPEPRQ
nr:MAG TPA: hypothetical protein [Siphoviridae sp. ctedi74]